MSLEDVKILIVDDEPDIREFISYNLIKMGAIIATSSDGCEAIEEVARFKPDLILLDIMMPKMDGVQACQEIRSNPINDDIIIAFLTARSEDFSQISALDSGGDDFISKPIRPKVLISRIKALLRRTRMASEDSVAVLQLGDIVIDKEKVQVTIKGEEVILPKKEFELLYLLASKPGRVFEREEIFTKIWGHDVIVGNRTIDVHIRKIREKIGQKYIRTIKGIGYKFEF